MPHGPMDEYGFVSRNGHPPKQRETDRAKIIATLAEMFCAQHEDEAHSGEACLCTRVNFAAFLALSVGVRNPEDIEEMVEVMLSYEPRRS